MIKKEAIVPVNQDAFSFSGENYQRFYYFERPNGMQLMASLGYICQGELCGCCVQNRPSTGIWILFDRGADWGVAARIASNRFTCYQIEILVVHRVTRQMNDPVS